MLGPAENVLYHLVLKPRGLADDPPMADGGFFANFKHFNIIIGFCPSFCIAFEVVVCYHLLELLI